MFRLRQLSHVVSAAKIRAMTTSREAGEKMPSFVFVIPRSTVLFILFLATEIWILVFPPCLHKPSGPKSFLHFPCITRFSFDLCPSHCAASKGFSPASLPSRDAAASAAAASSSSEVAAPAAESTAGGASAEEELGGDEGVSASVEAEALGEGA